MNTRLRFQKDCRKTLCFLVYCLGVGVACTHTSHSGAVVAGKPEGEHLRVCAEAGRRKLAAEQAYMHAKGKHSTNTQAVSAKEMEASWRALSKAARGARGRTREHMLWNIAALDFVKAEGASVKANAAYFRAANAREPIQTAAKRAQRADVVAQSASKRYNEARGAVSEQEINASWAEWKRAFERMEVFSKGHVGWNMSMMVFLEAKEAYWEAQKAHVEACP
ncbi:MAG: hypothetical protein FWC28_01030 [Proteobacteria bacterium]|nr:hypothetical protein [Cystobacterineae bacterium]MCL2259643.1 hypothetical protein [Cystobacterineae bacterium]MCL2313824.1 hypothetical protein [Pseudomonadota bacterium]